MAANHNFGASPCSEDSKCSRGDIRLAGKEGRNRNAPQNSQNRDVVDPSNSHSTHSTVALEDLLNQPMMPIKGQSKQGINLIQLDSDTEIMRVDSDISLEITIPGGDKPGLHFAMSDSSGESINDSDKRVRARAIFEQPGHSKGSKAAFSPHVGKHSGAFSASKKVVPFDQVQDGSNAEYESTLHRCRRFCYRVYTFVSRSIFQQHSEEEDHSHFTVLLEQTLRANMAWYFRSNVYWVALTLVLMLCCCVWFIPLRLFADLINTACLVRAARSIGGDAILSVFLARELVLDDGFTRMNNSLISANLRQARKDLSAALDAMRFGGTIAMEGNTVRTGADNLKSNTMNQYMDIMYQVCWKRT
jgi:hypothetical protein